MHCSKKSLSLVSVATIALFASLSPYTSNAPTWRDTPEGLLGSVLRGGSLGFSDYLSPGLKHRTEGFAHRNPLTSVLANIAGAVGGTMLGSTEEALAGQGLKSAAKYLVPSVAADKAALGLVSSVPIVSKLSTSVLPSALSSALQGGTYAYNTAAGSGPDPMQKALLGATLGGVGAGVLGGVERLVGPTVRAILGGSTAGKDRALKLAGRFTGLSNQGLLDQLAQLPGTARVYDAAPVSLGDRGLLGYAVAQHQLLMTAARKAAAADTADLVESGQALTAKHLGGNLPGSLGDFIDSAEAHRSEVTKPLYDIADNVSINLAAHPDLLKNYVLGDDYARYLGKVASNPATAAGDVREINRFLDNREGVIDAGNDVLKNYRNVPIPDQELRDIHSAAINDHIARSGTDFSSSIPLLSRYIDDLAYSRTRFNDTDALTRLVDNTKRAIAEVSPEYAAAQQAYRELSIPLNQADLAQSLEKGGGVNQSDSEATNEYIAANDKLRAEAKAAGQPDDSRPLTRSMLDEAIQKKARYEPSKTPQAILDTINNVVKPRLYAVYGSEPVDNLMRNATMHAQLINNRKGLVAMGVVSGGGFMGDVDHAYRTLVHSNTDKSMAEFLQLRPKEAIAHIQEYMLKHPEGKLPDYEKYLNSVLGNLAGKVANDGVAPSTSRDMRWDPVNQRWADGSQPSGAKAPSTFGNRPKWDPVNQRARK